MITAEDARNMGRPIQTKLLKKEIKKTDKQIIEATKQGYLSIRKEIEWNNSIRDELSKHYENKGFKVSSYPLAIRIDWRNNL